tara:strand:+ start:1172 stop:1597 length:426 start_codon:yes stop_codon:yes gene_type:complete
MQEEIKLTTEDLAEAIQGTEDLIGRIDYLIETLEDARKILEDKSCGSQEEYAVGDTMNLLQYVKDVIEEQYDETITTWFHGDIQDVGEFMSDHRLLLGRHASMDYRPAKSHESSSKNTWFIASYVSKDEIEKYNLSEGWAV